MSALPPMSAVNRLGNRVALADSPCTDKSGRLKYSRSLINVYMSRSLPRYSCPAMVLPTESSKDRMWLTAWHGRGTLSTLALRKRGRGGNGNHHMRHGLPLSNSL